MMARYAISASLLLLTLCLAVLVAFSVGSIPLAGQSLAVVQLQAQLHSGLVGALGKPFAVGLLLFVGLWPTFLVFGSARLRASAPEDRGSTESGDEGAEEQAGPVTPPVEDATEREVVSVLDRIATRHREQEAEAAERRESEEAGTEDPSGDGPEPQDDDDEPETGLVDPEFPDADVASGDDAPVGGDEQLVLDPGFAVDPIAQLRKQIGNKRRASDIEDEDEAEDDGEPAADLFGSEVGDPQPCEEPFNDEPAEQPLAEEIPAGDEAFDGIGSIDDDVPASDGLPSLDGIADVVDVESFESVEEMAAQALAREPEPDYQLPSPPKNYVDPYANDDGDNEPAPAASLATVIGGGAALALVEDEEEDEAEAGPRPDWLTALENQAIILRRLVPPPAEVGHSFFGGKPIVPEGFEWPRKKLEGKMRPLHFLMQVELSRVPEDARLGLLPEDGALYFFLDLEFGLPKGYRVVHAEGPIDGWREAEVPEDLGPLYGEGARYSWPWIDDEAEDVTGMPRLLPLWFFDPVASKLPAASPLERDGPNGTRWWPVDDTISEELARVQGDEVVPDDGKPLDENGVLLRPFPTYPHDWRAISIASVQVLDEIRKPSFAEACRHRQLSEEETRRMRKEWAGQAQEILDWANSHDPFDRVPAEESDMFWNWIRKLEAVNYLVIARAARHSIEATLSASPIGNEIFDEDALKLIRERHAVCVHTDEGLIVPNPHRMLAPPSYVQGRLDDIANKQVLLLEISADEGIGLLLGEGVYQFTIDPEDLAAKRFENVNMTISSC